MRKALALLLVLSLLVVPAVNADPPKPSSKDSITFDGQTYVLKSKASRKSVTRNEYILESEPLKTWTKMISVRHIPNLKDNTQVIADLAKILKAHNHDAAYAKFLNKDKTAEGIDFITWQGDKFAEFNIMIYRDSPDGKGLVAQQFAMRAYGKDMIPFLRRLPELRREFFPKVTEYKFPTIIE